MRVQRLISAILFLIIGSDLLQHGFRTVILKKEILSFPDILNLWIIRLIQGREAEKEYRSKILQPGNLVRSGKWDLFIGIVCLALGILSFISLVIYDS